MRAQPSEHARNTTPRLVVSGVCVIVCVAYCRGGMQRLLHTTMTVLLFTPHTVRC